MNQILKISIARGGCRFATPLYLGASYVLSFDGARSDEAKTVLFTKPNSRTPAKTEGIEGLAITVVEGSDIVLKLNRQSLVDWFMSCGECDVDGYVDAHCYVFNSDGDVIADDGVHIEYRPVDFVVDATGFTQYSALAERVGTLEAFRVEDRAKIDANESAIAELQDEDQSIRDDLAAAIQEKAGQTLESAKNYADLLRQMVAKMMYIRDVDESESAGYDRYRRVEAKKNSLNQVIISLSDELFNLEGGDSSTNRYLYTDTNNVEDYDEHGDPTSDHNPITGNKTFTGIVLVNTPLAANNSKKPATTAWVRTFDATQWDAHKAALLGAANTWSAKQTFSGGVEGNVTGNVTGNLTGNVTGNVTGNLTGGATVGSGKSLSVAGFSAFSGRETHIGEETHSGVESHTGAVTITNLTGPTNIVGSLELMADKKAVNLKNMWDMIAYMSQFFDGSYRIVSEQKINLNPNKTTSNYVGWRTTDRQTGLVSWFADEILSYGAYFLSGLSGKFLMPNVESVGDYGVYGNFFNYMYLPNCVQAGDYALGNTTVALTKDLIVLPKLEAAGTGCFEKMTNTTGMNLPMAKFIGTKAFNQSNKITELHIGTELDEEDALVSGSVAEVGGADMGDEALIDTIDWTQFTNDSAPTEPSDLTQDEIFTVAESVASKMTRIGKAVFNDNNVLVTFDAPNTQLILYRAVYDCNALKEIDITNALYIGAFAFTHAGGGQRSMTNFLQNLDISKCRYIGSRAFGSYSDQYWCSSVRYVKADMLKHVAYEAFRLCYSLQYFHAPELRVIHRRAFSAAYNFTGSSYYDEDSGQLVHQSYSWRSTVDGCIFNKCTAVNAEAFNTSTSSTSNTSMKWLALDACASIGYSAFDGIAGLSDIYLGSMVSSTVLNKADTGTTTTDDASIGRWGLPATAFSWTDESDHSLGHTGVALHMKDEYGNRVIVGYKNSTWQVIGADDTIIDE